MYRVPTTRRSTLGPENLNKDQIESLEDESCTIDNGIKDKASIAVDSTKVSEGQHDKDFGCGSVLCKRK